MRPFQSFPPDPKPRKGCFPTVVLPSFYERGQRGFPKDCLLGTTHRTNTLVTRGVSPRPQPRDSNELMVMYLTPRPKEEEQELGNSLGLRALAQVSYGSSWKGTGRENRYSSAIGSKNKTLRKVKAPNPTLTASFQSFSSEKIRIHSFFPFQGLGFVDSFSFCSVLEGQALSPLTPSRALKVSSVKLLGKPTAGAVRKPLSGTGLGRESSVSEYLSLLFAVLNTLDMGETIQRKNEEITHRSLNFRKSVPWARKVNQLFHPWAD
ncbi:hypothetical protein Acr_00g0003320 [Actinidia rufa]|uniref:Uncharacterized protein n=1 Tax=Actinidia rufa TaxID=165716 RepID=A0A7J0D8I5_9ERIC|nr:hypothetical protein Acr_00g0003320 [Actinidia rufa]